MKIYISGIVLLTTLTFLGCKKDLENPLSSLTSKSWKRGINDKNPSTNPQGPFIYYAVQNCERDDTFQFGSEGNLKINRNTEKCDQNEQQTETQTYIIDRTTKELIINGTTFTLAEESADQIKYYAPIPTTTGFQNLIILLQ